MPEAETVLSPLAGRFNGHRRDGLNGLGCVRGKSGFSEHRPRFVGESGETHPAADKG